MRAVGRRDRARPVLALHALDLGSDDVERLVPGDALVAGDSAVLRVALAVRIEVDALHRIEAAVGRVDDRLEVLAVGRERGLARRRVALAARLDGPGLGVAVVELDRREAQDLAVLDVDEHGPAVGHGGVAHRAVGLRDAVLPADGLCEQDQAGEPARELVRPGHGQLEVLDRVDLLLLVDRRRQQLGGDLRVLEREHHLGVGADAGTRGDAAVLEAEPATLGVVRRLDLGGEGLFLQSFRERRMPPAAVPEQEAEPPQDEGESRERHGCLRTGPK